MAAGDGVTLPDAGRTLVQNAGTVDLSDGEWPAAFLERAGETVCVAVSPYTGCYEFFDESGAIFWTVVPVLPTTENWVAPFRHAEEGEHPDDALYAPWRLVDVWFLSHARATGGTSSPSEPLRKPANLRTCEPATTNLCFTAFSFSETNLFFTASWPTNDALPDATLDLYGSTNLSFPRWVFLSSHPATNPPVSFAIERASLPWGGASSPSEPHVHDATCLSLTNLVVSPLDGTTVYTNVFWSCATNRAPGECGFFRLGTHLDTDGDGLFDAAERLVHATNPATADTDLDGLSDAEELDYGTDLLDPDTDGDGLSDGDETPRVFRGLSVPWVDPAGLAVLATNNLDEGVFTVPCPRFVLGGVLVTNVAVDVNGIASPRDAFKQNRPVNPRPVNAASPGAVFHAYHPSVAVYWDDLRLRPALGSRLLAGPAGGRFAVQWENVGFYDDATATNRISAQAVFEDRLVAVTYGELADSRAGASATFASQGAGGVPALPLGANAPGLVTSGETVVYFFGTGSSPLLADTDGDGVLDAEEVLLGTNPARADTDGDGLPDAWELGGGLDPLDPTGDDGAAGDPDGDGQINERELAIGTDPSLADTDGDGVPDGTTASMWRNNGLQATWRHTTNLVVFADADVPAGASACLRVGPLALPIPDGENVLALCLATNSLYAFSVRCTGGASVSLSLAPSVRPSVLRGPAPHNWTDRSSVFYLADPGAAFSGGPATTADGMLGYETFTFGPAPDCTEEPCIHASPGFADYVVAPTHPAALGLLDEADVSGFQAISATRYRLSVADEPPSGADGILEIPSPCPGFPVAVFSASIHRCDATAATPYCSLCGCYQPLDVSLFVSKTLLTLKHDNQATIAIVHPNSPLESFLDGTIQIRRLGEEDWSTLGPESLTAPWTARIAGHFELRGLVRAGGRDVATAPVRIEVQFPSVEQIATDPAVIEAADAAWFFTTVSCADPPHYACEYAFAIRLNTTNDTYVCDNPDPGPELPPWETHWSMIVAEPYNAPESPEPTDSGAVYLVAGFHTHPSAEYLDSYADFRDVGPSPKDEDTANNQGIPGIVMDYAPISGRLRRIPAGHSTSASPMFFFTTNVCRRATP